jgi:plasmid stability protein
MASLSVRKLDPRIYEGLRMRAAKHGISMEEEARRILSQAVLAPDKMSKVFQNYFGPENGVELELPNQTPHNPIEI